VPRLRLGPEQPGDKEPYWARWHLFGPDDKPEVELAIIIDGWGK
jgi:hypothetical protein